MAMIARGCYNNSTFVNIDSTYTPYTIGPTNLTSQNRTFSHRHLMLKNRAFYYEYCKGGKTGFTDQSGYTLVTFAEKDDMRLICVCFKSTDTGRYADTRSLFDWGFGNFKKVTASGNAISSLFNNTSYYNSAVFNKYNLNLKLNASTLTIPSSGSVGNVTMGVDQNYSPSDDNGTYAARVDFQYSGNTVGTATLTMASANALNASSNLPYISDTDNKTAPSAKKCIVVNVWFLIVAGVLILIGIHFLNERKRSQRRNLHTTKRHLHY
jgi:D-alanyl-D-alanine carboxypeptidase